MGRTGIYACGESVRRRNSLESVALFSLKQEAPASIGGSTVTLLLFLARHPNQVFSKKYLFEMIWHLDALGELATVTVHVNRLRDKLNEVQPEFTAIETVWGNGYRFRVEE